MATGEENGKSRPWTRACAHYYSSSYSEATTVLVLYVSFLSQSGMTLSCRTIPDTSVKRWVKSMHNCDGDLRYKTLIHNYMQL